MLEHRVTVAKSALRGIEGKALAGRQINRVERLKTVLQLNPIRANVLHRGCAHTARDERQILQAGIAVFKRPGHQVVPVFTCARLHNPGLGGLADEPFSHDLDFQHQWFHIPRQHNVAATTQNEFGHGFQG